MPFLLRLLGLEKETQLPLLLVLKSSLIKESTKTIK